jgi:cytochrome c oxidase cbb3-type subunit 2
MFESKAGVLLIGGLAFFVFAFVSNAMVPIFMYQDLPEQKVAELVNANLMYEWEDLGKRFPDSFKEHFGEPTKEKCAEALLLGRKVYVGEGCWHCHSQFVRPVSNESLRFGPVAKTEEYQNELQRPVMFGTRRVGPDLSREGGRRSNDWHAVHFHRPEALSTNSPMPEYPWFFDGAANKPNKRGLAIILYVQWLGSWLESYPYYEDYKPVEGMNLKQTMPPAESPATPTISDDKEPQP